MQLIKFCIILLFLSLLNQGFIYTPFFLAPSLTTQKNPKPYHHILHFFPNLELKTKKKVFTLSSVPILHFFPKLKVKTKKKVFIFVSCRSFSLLFAIKDEDLIKCQPSYQFSLQLIARSSQFKNPRARLSFSSIP